MKKYLAEFIGTLALVTMGCDPRCWLDVMQQAAVAIC